MQFVTITPKLVDYLQVPYKQKHFYRKNTFAQSFHISVRSFIKTFCACITCYRYFHFVIKSLFTNHSHMPLNISKIKLSKEKDVMYDYRSNTITIINLNRIMLYPCFLYFYILPLIRFITEYSFIVVGTTSC